MATLRNRIKYYDLSSSERFLLGMFAELDRADRERALRFASLLSAVGDDPDCIGRIRALANDPYRVERESIDKALDQLEELVLRLSESVDQIENTAKKNA